MTTTVSPIASVTDATFESEVLDAPGTVLVDFWAEWCGPCRALERVLDSIAAAHPELTVVKINADDNPGSAAAYRTLALPTMKVFQGGEVVRTIVGAQPQAALEAQLAPYLA